MLIKYVYLVMTDVIEHHFNTKHTIIVLLIINIITFFDIFFLILHYYN